MKLKLFTVYDSKIGAFAQPFFMQSKGQALRSWMDVVNDKSTQFCKHPEDFTLFEIAEYDDSNGKFENLPAPISLGTALEVHKGYPQEAL